MCVEGKVTAWHTAFARHRAYPVDMAAFAVNLQLLLDSPTAQFPRDKYDYVETDFLEQLPVSEKDLKCCDHYHEVCTILLYSVTLHRLFKYCVFNSTLYAYASRIA